MIVFPLLLLTGCLADIRPSAVDPASPQIEEAEAGWALLEASAEAHGYDAWLAADRVELSFSDDWFGMYKLASPWPTARMTGDMVMYPGSFDSTVQFTSGKKQGWMWGINDWQTWTIDPNGVREDDTDDGNIAFMLPTAQYFVDLPFRLLEAEHVRAIGTETVRGTPYDVVYATWGDVAVDRDYDQYVVYLDPDTHRVAMVQYTVREIAKFVTGTAHYRDLRETDGVWVAHEMVVNGGPDKDPASKSLHTMGVSDIAWFDDDGQARAARLR